MGNRQDGATLRRLRALFNVGAIRELSDGQLLERFATLGGEEAEMAFAALVERHGPMVLRVCRGVLVDPHDAQDAFQATFLVLVKKARGLWVRDSIGPWLHQVAFRVASAARTSAARRRRLERRAEGPAGRAGPGFADDLRRAIHEEIGRLPDRQRAPVVLCDLEGRTHEQAARHLGWPIGTVKSRLSRARERLRDRLSRRGLAPGSGLLPLAAPLPPALVDATTAAAARFLAARAIAPGAAALLAQGVLRTMIVLRWIQAASAVLAVAAATSGLALLAQDGPGNGDWPAGNRLADAPAVPVRPGKFRLALSERGEVQATKVADMHSEVERPTTIIRILPEGSRVEQGEVVCELDSAELRDTLTNQRITAQQAEASYKQAVLTREVADFAVKEYADGRYKQERNALAVEIELTQTGITKGIARLERTRQARKRLEEIMDPKMTRSPSDVAAFLVVEDKLEEAELSLDRQRAALKLAKDRLETLENYTRDLTFRQLVSEVDRARFDEFDRKATWELEKTRAAKLERQIRACVFRAPTGGIVVYANERRPGRLMIEEGATVRERQKILGVVDLDGPMRVVSKVHEPRVDRVSRGLGVRVKVDALPGETFTGAVESVAPRPDVQQTSEQGPKLYTTRVALEKGSPMLRPGMSVRVEILILEHDDVLTVPASSVVLYGDKTHVAVKLPEGKVDWREVSLGEENGEVVEVRQGLKAGEAVVLDPLARMTEDEKRRMFGSPIPPTRPAAAPR